MSNGNYDLLTGINQDKLNQIVAKVYNTPSLQSSLFSGSQSGAEMGVNYRVDWAVKSAPLLNLSPPAPNDWARAIGADGGSVAARAGAMLINLPKLALKIEAGDSKLDETIPVQALASVSSSGSKLIITALGVIVDLSQASPMDKMAIKLALVPEILTMLNRTLSGIEIPQLTFSGVRLTAPVVEARDGYVLAAFNLQADGAPTVGTGPIPKSPFFAIASRELVQFISDYQVQHEVQGKTFDQRGKESGGGFSAEYAVHGRIDAIRVMVGSNPVAMRARASLSMSASAGVSTPVGMVIDAMGNVVKDVGKVAEDIGKAIINPNTWNPTKW